jgi:hypothetical protein
MALAIFIDFQSFYFLIRTIPAHSILLILNVNFSVFDFPFKKLANIYIPPIIYLT